MRSALALGIVVIVGALPFVWQAWIEWRYRPLIFPLEEVRTERVAIVFGARIYNNGRLSAMLRDRVDTAIALYKADKVQKLLLSGDNRFVDYNEPQAMMDYAIVQGVRAEDIQPDYGGRRTYDSCYRAKAIFQIESALLVTQTFHLPRALFLCRQLGIDALGVAADRRLYDPRSMAFSETREIPALVVALYDVLRRAPPPVLGEAIPIE
jgi:SanA protein